MAEGAGLNAGGAGVQFGFVPQGVQLRRGPEFPPEIEAALKFAREQSGGRYMVMVFTSDRLPNGEDNLTLVPGRGPSWSDDWFHRAYKLFLGDFLIPTPEMLASIQRNAPAPADSQAAPPAAQPAQMTAGVADLSPPAAGV